jgi:hypothetical protein
MTETDSQRAGTEWLPAGLGPALAMIGLCAGVLAALELAIVLAGGATASPLQPVAPPWSRRRPVGLHVRCSDSAARRPRVPAGAEKPAEINQCSVRSTPRRSRARAMISRWISLVPSQMRSTRSSRKKRSATFVRM